MKIYSSSRPHSGMTDNTVLDSRTRTAAGSLFDRLVMCDEDIEPQVSDYEVDGIIRSVKRNLRRALNVHAGSASANVAFGVPDFNHSTISSLEVSMHLVDSIRSCIELAEPRMHDVTVRSKSDPNKPLELDFAIMGTLRVGNKDELIRIDIAMKDGHFYPS